MQKDDKKKMTDLMKEVSELTKTLNDFIKTSSNFDTGVGKDVTQIQKDIAEIKLLITNNYVRREEFLPVQKIVYGLVSVILLGVIGSIMAFVLK